MRFDVILGMDWLVSCRATNDPIFVFQGDKSEAPSNLISTLGA